MTNLRETFRQLGTQSIPTLLLRLLAVFGAMVLLQLVTKMLIELGSARVEYLSAGPASLGTAFQGVVISILSLLGLVVIFVAGAVQFVSVVAAIIGPVLVLASRARQREEYLDQYQPPVEWDPTPAHMPSHEGFTGPRHQPTPVEVFDEADFWGRPAQ